MKIPKYIQRKRTKGFKLPENTLCCTRPSIWSNPWTEKDVSEMQKQLYPNTLKSAFDLHLRISMNQRILDLSELLNYDYLACWCPEDAEYCHVQHSLIPRLREILQNVEEGK